MPRLITYGCSFTSWKWSTWADILAEQLDLELINRGRVAGANNFALHRLKHDIKNGLFENDDVIRIMWCTYNRVSKIIDIDDFEFVESTTNKHKKIKNFLSNIELIKEADQLLQGLNYDFLSMIDPKQDGSSMDDLIPQINNHEMPKFKKAIHPSILDVVMQGNWNKRTDYAIDLLNTPAIIRKNLFKQAKKQGKSPVELIRQNSQIGDGKYMIFFDYHPTPLMHLEYLQAIYPHIIWKKNLIDKIHHENQQILSVMHETI